MPAVGGQLPRQSSSITLLQTAADSSQASEALPDAGREIGLARALGREKAELTADSALPPMQNDIWP